MSYIDSDRVLYISVNANELSEMFLRSAEKSRKKAEIYRERAKQLEGNVSSEEVDHDEFVASYGSSVANNIVQAKKTMLDKAREHDNLASQKEFIAKHLPPGNQVFPPGLLKVWELV